MVENIRQSRKALQESEKQYRTLVESLEEGIASFDENENFTFINPAACNIFGYSKAELLQMNFKEILTPEDHQKMLQQTAMRRIGKSSEYDINIIMKNGDIRILAIRISPIFEKGEYKGSFGIFRDITIQKQAEDELKKKTDQIISNQKELEKLYGEAEHSRKSLLSILEDVTEKEKDLRESEGKYRLLAENTLDCIWKMDKDLKFTYINQSIFPMLGFTREEWAGSTLTEHCSKKELQHFMNIVEDELRKEESYSAMFELNLFHKNGSEIPLEILGKILLDENKQVIGFQGNARDVTDRKQAEKIQKTLYDISNALNTTDNMHLLCQKVREFLGNVIDTKNFYIALYDEKTDVISLPFEVDEKDKYESFPAGKTLTKYVIRLEKPLFAPRKLQDELTEQGKIEVIGTPSEIWLGAPLKVENSVIGVIAVQSYDDPNLYTEKDIEILTFISEEIALAIKHKQAEEQTKRDLKEKELLLREIHHRVKNNLQVISGLLQLQENEITTKEDALKGFAASQDRILAMAKAYELLLGSEYMSEVKVGKYIESLAGQLKRNYDIHHKVKISYYFDELTINIEILDRLGLILNEIITNSIKYAFEGRDSGNINIELTDKKDSIVLVISDNGVGIPEDINIYNPDTLGLSLVDMLTKQLWGNIEIRQEKWDKLYTGNTERE